MATLKPILIEAPEAHVIHYESMALFECDGSQFRILSLDFDKKIRIKPLGNLRFEFTL